MKEIKVLHVLPSLTVGGAERLVIDILKKMNIGGKIKSDLCVINDLIDSSLLEEAKAAANVYLLKRKLGSKDFRVAIRLRELIRREKYDIVNSHLNFSFLWVSLCKIMSPVFKLVCTVHATITIPTAPWYQMLLHKLLVSKTICISEAVRTKCDDAGIKNVAVIKNGVDTARFLNEDFRKSLFDKRAIKIVNVARFNVHIKGQDILIEAVKICKDKGLPIYLDLIGQGDRKSVDTLNDLIERCGLSQTVSLESDVKDISQVLKDYDLFVLPSRFEGFGLVIVEAMASGLPVITSNIPGPNEIVKDAFNGFLFNSEDSEDLAKKIEYVYMNYSSLEQLRQRALERAKEFDISNMCKLYFKEYEKLLFTKVDLE